MLTAISGDGAIPVPVSSTGADTAFLSRLYLHGILYLLGIFLSNSSQPCSSIYPAEIRLLITIFYDFLFIIALGALCCSALICILRNHVLRHDLLNGKGKQGFQNAAMGLLAAEKCGTRFSISSADVHTTNVPSLLLLSPTHQGCQIQFASW